MEKDYTKFSSTADILKALAHPARLCIVKGLIDNDGCNVTHMQSCMDLPQSTISQHLQKLRAAKIIEGTRNGLEIKYRVSDKRVIRLLKVFFNS